MKRYPLTLLALLAFPVFAGSYEDLIMVSKTGNVQAMHTLMKKGLDPDSTDRQGNTLLTIAATEGNEPLVKVLIEYKAKLNARNANGETALQLAAFRGHETIVKDLLGAGARTETPGWPALIYATYAGYDKIVDMLLASGADKDAIASNGMTALMFAVQQGRQGLVTKLLDAGADPEIMTPKGDTAYSLALKSQQLEITKLIEAAQEKQHRKQQVLNEEPQHKAPEPAGNSHPAVTPAGQQAGQKPPAKAE